MFLKTVSVIPYTSFTHLQLTNPKTCDEHGALALWKNEEIERKVHSASRQQWDNCVKISFGR